MNDVLKSHSSMSSANDSFHLEKNPSDYYIRISWTGSGEKSVRTETIYHTSNPRFDGKEMEFEVSHYGMEFKLELIDANSDEAVGIALITAQGLLQEQRDRLLNDPDFSVWSLFDPKKFSGAGKRRTNLALRTNVKNGFGLNFFDTSSNATDDAHNSVANRKERTSRWYAHIK